MGNNNFVLQFCTVRAWFIYSMLLLYGEKFQAMTRDLHWECSQVSEGQPAWVDFKVLLGKQNAVFLVQQSLRAKDPVPPVILSFTLRVNQKINGNVGRPLEEKKMSSLAHRLYSMTFGFLKEAARRKKFFFCLDFGSKREVAITLFSQSSSRAHRTSLKRYFS